MSSAFSGKREEPSENSKTASVTGTQWGEQSGHHPITGVKEGERSLPCCFQETWILKGKGAAHD